MKNIIILSLLASLSYLNATTFYESKKILLKKIYFDNKKTFYCNNPFEIKRIGHKQKTLIINDDTYYTPRKSHFKNGKENHRAKRVEWEHIVPAHSLGKHLACWKKGGRKACRRDENFRTMEADMHNLVPAIGEINQDRSNFKYNYYKPEVGQYGNCPFQVDFKKRRAYIKEDIRGDIARTYFYMSDMYNMKLSKQELRKFIAWDKADPVSEWEVIKNNRIYKIQGNKNPYISQ